MTARCYAIAMHLLRKPEEKYRSSIDKFIRSSPILNSLQRWTINQPFTVLARRPKLTQHILSKYYSFSTFMSTAHTQCTMRQFTLSCAVLDNWFCGHFHGNKLTPDPQVIFNCMAIIETVQSANDRLYLYIMPHVHCIMDITCSPFAWWRTIENYVWLLLRAPMSKLPSRTECPYAMRGWLGSGSRIEPRIGTLPRNVDGHTQQRMAA